jgi:hypothetical protein
MPDIVPGVNEHWLPSKAYDTIKAFAQTILPGVGTLYFALAAIWGLPDAEQVIGTITAVDAFLGVFLTVAKSQYLKTDSPYGGSINVSTPIDGPKTYSLVINGDPAKIDEQKQVLFKVNTPEGSQE